jgi:mannose PTS system EIIA component
MVGILIMVHAPLGSAFLTAVRHVFHSDPECLEVLDVLPDQSTEEVIQRARQAIQHLNSGDGVLVLTDMSGATPANCSQQLDVPGQVAVLAGLSLPMLLRALTYRNDGLEKVVEMAQAGAQSGAVRLRLDR